MSDIIYPFYFTKNICLHCGSEGKLRFIDKYGNLSRNPIYYIEKMKCTNCNTEYFLQWIKKEDESYFPVCTGNNTISEFQQEIIQYNMENKRDIRRI